MLDAMFRRFRAAAACGVALMIVAGAQDVRAQAPPDAENLWILRDWTRVEIWRFFQPNAGGGDPDYTHIANRLQAGYERRARKYDVTGVVQYVQFGNLPTNAVGPGPLGSGALYYQQSGATNSNQVYLRYLNLRLKEFLPGVTAQVGRFGYTSGAESPSGDAAIESVKRQRLDSRLLGEFEWALYQRGFDGGRLDVDRPVWHATAAVFKPTQGGFEESAGVEIQRITVYTGAVSVKPSSPVRRTDWQIFANRYDDTRDVQARPDNTSRTASAVDVHINTFGASVAGVYPIGPGRMDVVGWFAAQTGDWYGQSHRAVGAAAEAGYQWTNAPGRLWLRGGWFHGSGDANPTDDHHNTFFPVLPTIRKYSLSTVYSLMNLDDAFAQALAFPTAKLNLRIDLHHLTLAEGADRWYSGSGANAATGNSFGYAGRVSNGATSLGTMLEGSADRTITKQWSINAYAGVMHGGAVVRGLFAGDWLTFIYFENVLRL